MIDINTMTIAIVDDMENMCKSIRGMLKILEYGKKFFIGHNGRDALEILNQHDVDLLIMDWNMPVMKGVEALGCIREDAKLRDMPVIMVTAEANREIVAEAAESDIDAYLLKPITIQSLGEKIKAVVENANNPPPLVTSLKKARDAREAGDIKGALAYLQEACKADPSSSKPFREMGSVYFDSGEYTAAEKWLIKAAEMNRYDVFAFHLLGELYLKKNNIEKAAKYFDKAMQVSPRHVDRGIHFGKALVKKGITDKAKKVFDRALNLAGDDMELLEDVALFCMENDANDYAVHLFRSVLKVKPDRTDIMMNLGMLLEKTGKSLEALEYYNKLEKEAPDNLDVKFHMIQCFIAVDQPLRADRVVRDILKIDPGNEQARDILKALT
jgi:DNA-binding response OmpR family regulator